MERGRFTFPNGVVYEGEFVKNKSNARVSDMHRGRLTYLNGDVYEGEFVNNKRDGRGKMTYVNGNVYEGEFVNNMFVRGKMTYVNRAVYEGEFVDSKMHGRGKMTFPSGVVYEGEWVDDFRHGKGIMTYPRGDVYEGEFVDNKMHGRGIMTYMSGIVYEGEWVDNSRHGKCIMTYPGGDVYEGEFISDKMRGNGKLTFVNGDVYEGEFVDNKMWGTGSMAFANGDRFEGFWDGYGDGNDGNMQGKMTYVIGDVFEGVLVKNMRKNGTMTHMDGRVYEGMWENDKPILGVMNTIAPIELVPDIQVLDTIYKVPAPEFLADRTTFIIVNSLGEQYRHIGINMTTATKTIFVECKDNTPPGLGSAEYPEYIKEETKDNLYMKMPINDGALIMVQLPIILTGTRFFKIVPIGPIKLFMDIDFAKGKQISMVGADHCNQTEPQKVYRLVELGVDELKEIIAKTKDQEHLQEKEETEATAKEAKINEERGPAIKIKYNNQEVIISYSTPPEETTIGWVKEQFRKIISSGDNNPATITFIYGGTRLADGVFISALRDYPRAVLLAIVSYPRPPAPPDEDEAAKGGFNKHRKSKKHNRRTKKHHNRRKTRTKRHYKRFKTMRK
jgi:hypothetical protein